MQHRTITADVLVVNGKLIVLKGDIDQGEITAIANSFKKNGLNPFGIIALGCDSDITLLTVDQATDLLRQIINKQEIK